MRKSKSELLIYFILRLAVLIVLVAELISGRWNNVFLCILTLVLFMIPSIVEHRMKLEIPSLLEIIVLLFIFAAEILGEIAEFYVRVANWDVWLHTINGFLMAAIGFGMIDVLNRSPRFHISLSPAFVAFVAFCFSMTIGVLWEFFEYFMDQVFTMDMQKDTLVTFISSVLLHPDGSNSPVIIRDITQTTVTSVTAGVAADTVIQGGYLDIGIHDTMKDMFVNCIGAVVFSVLGVFYIHGRGHMAGRFIPKLMTDEEAQSEKDYIADEIEKRRRRRRQRIERRRHRGDGPQEDEDSDESTEPGETPPAAPPTAPESDS